MAAMVMALAAVTTGTVWCNTTAVTTGTVWCNVAYHPRRLTEAERAQELAHEARLKREMEQLRLAKEKADRTAEALLLQFLNEAQRAQFQKDRYFEVLAGKDGCRRYRIHQGWAGNIDVFDPAGRKIERLCIHPVDPIPHADVMLAQKLMLEADEDEFRRVANITRFAA